MSRGSPAAKSAKQGQSLQAVAILCPMMIGRELAGNADRTVPAGPPVGAPARGMISKDVLRREVEKELTWSADARRMAQCPRLVARRDNAVLPAKKHLRPPPPPPSGLMRHDFLSTHVVFVADD